MDALSLGWVFSRDRFGPRPSRSVIAYSEAKLGEASSVYDILIAYAGDRALGVPVNTIGE